MPSRTSLFVRPLFLIPAGCVAVAAAVALTNALPASAAQAPVKLGTATSFAVLAGSTVTNTGPSVVSGDLGVSPGSAVTGFRPPPAEPGLVIHGSIHAADRTAALAQTDEATAYVEAAGRSPVTHVPVELGGRTLVGGVYSSATLGLTGTLTLSGDASSVWVFKTASTLITGTASRIVLTGGATACNVFWKIGSSATLGSGSAFTGTVLAHTSITADTGASVRGRLFAQTAAVTLDDNVITRPTCRRTPVGTSSAPGSSAPGSGTSSTGPGGGTGHGHGHGHGSGHGSGTATAGAPGRNPHSHPGGNRSGTPGHGTPSASAPSSVPSTGVGRSTNHLAKTGSDLRTPLVVGLLGILSGALLLGVTRRRATGPRHRR